MVCVRWWMMWMLGALIMGGAVFAADRPPNIVFILTDNQGAWTLGCYGNPDIRTPNIDRMASEGVLFTRAFSSNPVCSPTRATYLTGLIPSQHGVHRYLAAGEAQMGPGAYCTIGEFRTLPRIFKDAGYVCGLSGKWHLGANLVPQEGFSYWITMPHGHTTKFYDAEVIENGQVRNEPKYLTDLWTEHGVKFIEQNRDKPFFLMLSYNGPYGLGKSLLEPARNRHAAYYADKPMLSFPRDAVHPWQHANKQYVSNIDAIRRVAAEVSGVDDGVGEIFATLRRLGLDENTLVVYAADQGWVGGQNGLWGMGDHTRPLTAFDGMMRIPLIFRHPQRIPAGRQSDLMVSNYDFMPTLLSYLGMSDQLPVTQRSPGRDYSAVLKGREIQGWDNTVYVEFENLRSIRTEKWKYVHREPEGPFELYDLESDPHEKFNLYGQPQHAAKGDDLRARLFAFFDTYADPKWDLYKGGGSKTRVQHHPRPDAQAAAPARSSRNARGSATTPLPEMDFVVTDGLAVNYIASQNPGHPARWTFAGGSARAGWKIGADASNDDAPRQISEASQLPGIRAAYQFDGVNDIMTRAAFTPPPDSTFEVWFRPDRIGDKADQVIFETGDDERGLSLRLLGDKLRLVHRGGPDADRLTLSFDLDSDDDGKIDIDGGPWYEFIQAMAVIDAKRGQLRLHVNNRQRETIRLKSADFYTGAGGAGLGGANGQVGGGRDGFDPAPAPFAGMIASLRRYTRALDAREVRQNYEAIVVLNRAKPADEAVEFTPAPMIVPDGFTVEVAAAYPLVEHPMMACLDDRGRMFIAESAGVNMKAPELLEARPHKIIMLEDTDGDGVFDKRTVFAENLVLPNGALWHDGALYVCSPPYIWRYEDTDGDGRADKQQPIFGKFGFNGMSSAFHGPVLSPSGRLYWCGGQHGWVLGDTSEGLNLGGPWTSRAPGVFSCWPDGSDPQDHAHGGLANPVEATFTNEGEVFGTVAVYMRLNNQRRDALLHWVEGSVYNLPEAKRAGLKLTGDVPEALSLRGHVAPAGVMTYRSGAFGSEYTGNVFLTEFNTHKVYRLIIERDGATFRSRDEVFLESPDTDTHFTDVFEDADGSLLAIDTGGWFLYGCPTSRLAKPSILGAIYRIRRTDSRPPADPRGLTIEWYKADAAKLVTLLDDARFAVRDGAIVELARRGERAIPALQSALIADSAQLRRNAVWALTRIDSPAARKVVRLALDDHDLSVRLSAVHSVTTRRDGAAHARLRDMVVNDEPPVRREAATALGRIGNAEAIDELVNGIRVGGDRLLEHALIYALIQINDPQRTIAALSDTDPNVQRAALIALDQMDSNPLTREMIGPLLTTRDANLQRAAMQIVTRREGWADEIIALLNQWLGAGALDESQTELAAGALLAFKADEQVQRLLAATLDRSDLSKATRLMLLDVIGESRLDNPPKSWLDRVAAHLQSNDQQIVLAAIRAVGGLRVDRFDSRLKSIVLDANQSMDLRIAALGAYISRAEGLDTAEFTLLVERLKSKVTAEQRLEAAQVLGAATLTRYQLLQVAELFEQAGALELPLLLRPFEKSSDAKVGSTLVSALAQSPGLWNVPVAQLRQLFERYPSVVRSTAEPLLDQFIQTEAQQAARLAELQGVLQGGNAATGKAAFTKAACIVCHRAEGVGGLIGPDLSKIAAIRTPSDLLEAIVFPSASFARGYEPYTIETTDGQSHYGLLTRETQDTVYLTAPTGLQTPVRRQSIARMNPSPVSPMPQGLERILTESELRDLIAYLKQLK